MMNYCSFNLSQETTDINLNIQMFLQEIKHVRNRNHHCTVVLSEVWLLSHFTLRSCIEELNSMCAYKHTLTPQHCNLRPCSIEVASGDFKDVGLGNDLLRCWTTKVYSCEISIQAIECCIISKPRCEITVCKVK